MAGTSLGKVGIIGKGAYSASVAYKEGQFVFYLGSTYIALKDLIAGTTPVNDGVNWAYLAEGASVDEVLTSIAPVEESATSTGAYDIGDYLLYNSALYKATAPISIGDTLTIGTNIAAAVMGEDLAAVKAEADNALANFAPVETATASRAYTAGEHLIFNGRYCRATTSIAASETLAIGTNLAVDNVASKSDRYQAMALSTGARFNFIQNFTPQRYIQFNCVPEYLRLIYTDNGTQYHNVDLNEIKHQTIQIAKSSSQSVAVVHNMNAMKALVIGHASQSGLCGLYLILGASSIATIVAAANLTVSISNWTLTVTNSNTSSAANGIII